MYSVLLFFIIFHFHYSQQSPQQKLLQVVFHFKKFILHWGLTCQAALIGHHSLYVEFTCHFKLERMLKWDLTMSLLLFKYFFFCLKGRDKNSSTWLVLKIINSVPFVLLLRGNFNTMIKGIARCNHLKNCDRISCKLCEYDH